MIPKPENCIVLDFETTGLDPLKDRIIEVYGVKLGFDFEIESDYYSLVHYEGKLPPVITAITGIDSEKLAMEGRPSEEVFREFAIFCDNRILVGHNIIKFDFPFLRAELNRIGLDLFNEVWDTLEESRKIFKFYGYGLEQMAKHLGIYYDRLHNARSDVKVTLELFRHLSKTSD